MSSVDLNEPTGERITKFVVDNFELKRCQRYVRIDDVDLDASANSEFFNPDDCVCGHPLDWHVRQRIAPKRPMSAVSGDIWDPIKDTATSVCNSFGQLSFVAGEGYDASTIVPGAKAHYIRLEGRLDNSLYMEKVYKLMTDKTMWALPVPQLIIEVTGAAYELPHTEQAVLDRFNDGLINAAKAANAWIVTGGINKGVMGMVGDAVSKWRMTQREKITCIGIAPWGIINHRERLVNFEPEFLTRTSTADGGATKHHMTGHLGISADMRTSNVTRNANKRESTAKSTLSNVVYGLPKYPVELAEKCEDGVVLNPGHNCFLLIDNGKEKRYGEEINFRAQFLQYLSKKTIRTTGSGSVSRTPLVLLVVGGGTNTLKTVDVSLRSSSSNNFTRRDRRASVVELSPSDGQRPVVILPGFGGAADLLAFAYAITAPTADKDRGLYGKQNFGNDEVSEIPADFDQRIRKHPAYEEILLRLPPNHREEEGAVILIRLRNCLKDRSMVTVVNIHDENEFVPLDHAILNAIFKSKFGTPASTFELAQLWDRVDVAKRLLSQYDAEIKKNIDMKASMTRAILFGQSNFVKVLVDYGFVDLNSYLSLGQIRRLYADMFIRRRGKAGKATCVRLFRNLLMNAIVDNALTDLAEGPKMLESLGKILSGLLGCYLDNVFTDEKWYVTALSQAMTSEGSQNSVRAMDAVLALPYETSIRDLFILQLLLCRTEMAIYVWQLGHDHLGTALMASVFLKALSREADRLDMTDLGNFFCEQHKEWLNRAIYLLSSCYEQDHVVCNKLLTRCLLTWQRMTVLEMAFFGNKKRFMEHPAVQTTLSKVWLGQMATFTRPSLVYLTMLPPCLPFLIFRIRFELKSTPNGTDESNESSKCSATRRFFKALSNLISCPTKCSRVSEIHGETVSETSFTTSRGCFGCCQNEDIDDDDAMSSVSSLSAFAALSNKKKNEDVRFTKATLCNFNKPGRISVLYAAYLVYSSPIAKYTVHSLTNVAFLLLFSYFVLEGIHSDDIGIVEMILWICCTVAFLDLVRDGFGKSNLTIRERMEDFFFNIRIIVELIALALIVAATTLRFLLPMDADNDNVLAHSCYATACVVWWLKSLRIFFITETVGPKVFTLFKMLRDLVFFVLIYLMLLLSFSMPIYALLYPNQRIDGIGSFANLLLNISYQRMWNIFVVGLDDAKADVEGTCNRQVYTRPFLMVETRHRRFVNNHSGTDASIFASSKSLLSSSYASVYQHAYGNSTMMTNLTFDDPTEAVIFQQTGNYSAMYGRTCSSRNIVAIALYVIYLLLTNIVLLNMLIAMFAHTVDKTRLSATRLWRFDMYQFLYEYYMRPVLPGPLMIFELLYRFIIHIYRQISRKDVPENSDLKQFYPSLHDFEYRKIELFERSAVESALAEAARESYLKSHSLLDSKLRHFYDRLNGKLEQVEVKVAETLDHFLKDLTGHVKQARGGTPKSSSQIPKMTHARVEEE